MLPPGHMLPMKAPKPPTQLRCAVTGKLARYRDPGSGYGYADLEAYKELKQRLQNERKGIMTGKRTKRQPNRAPSMSHTTQRANVDNDDVMHHALSGAAEDMIADPCPATSSAADSASLAPAATDAAEAPGAVSGAAVIGTSIPVVLSASGNTSAHITEAAQMSAAVDLPMGSDSAQTSRPPMAADATIAAPAVLPVQASLDRSHAGVSSAASAAAASSDPSRPSVFQAVAGHPHSSTTLQHEGPTMTGSCSRSNVTPV